MFCPTCGEEMFMYKQDSSFSTKKSVKYQRSRYKCERDDTWGSLEIPVGPMTPEEKQHAIATQNNAATTQG
jgi:hypothetical protein